MEIKPLVILGVFFIRTIDLLINSSERIFYLFERFFFRSNDLVIRPNESFICSNDSFIRSNDLLIRLNEDFFLFGLSTPPYIHVYLQAEKKN